MVYCNVIIQKKFNISLNFFLIYIYTFNVHILYIYKRYTYKKRANSLCVIIYSNTRINAKLLKVPFNNFEKINKI